MLSQAQRRLTWETLALKLGDSAAAETFAARCPARVTFRLVRAHVRWWGGSAGCACLDDDRERREHRSRRLRQRALCVMERSLEGRVLTERRARRGAGARELELEAPAVHCQRGCEGFREACQASFRVGLECHLELASHDGRVEDGRPLIRAASANRAGDAGMSGVVGVENEGRLWALETLLSVQKMGFRWNDCTAGRPRTKDSHDGNRGSSWCTCEPGSHILTGS
eukprot:3430044-Rhodomonas_salina.1